MAKPYNGKMLKQTLLTTDAIRLNKTVKKGSLFQRTEPSFSYPSFLVLIGLVCFLAPVPV